jgi:hypothetical protein
MGDTDPWVIPTPHTYFKAPKRSGEVPDVHESNIWQRFGPRATQISKKHKGRLGFSSKGKLGFRA